MVSELDSVRLTNQHCDTHVAKRPRITPRRPESTSSLNGWEPADPSDAKPKQVRSMVTLCNHFYARGLIDGIGSDIVVSAFGKDWNLHRIVLCNSPYFEALFCGGWKESEGTKLVLKFNEDHITEDTFGIVIARLYGRIDDTVNEQNVFDLLATANYFQLQDFAWDCADFILGNLRCETIPTYLDYFEEHFHGDISASIVSACFAALCREGYDTFKQCWVHLSPLKVREILASDAFWVPSEYHRYLFARDLWIERKAIMQLKVPESDSETSPTENSIEVEFLEATGSNVSEIPIPPSDVPPCSIDKLPEGQTSATDEQKVANSLEGDKCVDKEDGDEDEVKENEDEDEDEDEDDKDDEEDEEDEEDIYRDILDNRIRYMHMTFEQIREIQNDRDPDTGRPYVRASILHKALWQQVDLRVCVTNAKTNDTELKSKVEGFEPFRFCVEFSDVNKLRKGEAKYFNPFFYAGSEWEVYITTETGKPGEPVSLFFQRLAHNFSESDLTTSDSGATFSRYQDSRNIAAVSSRFYYASCGPSYSLTTKSMKMRSSTSKGWKNNIIPKEYYLRRANGLEVSGKLRISVALNLR